MGEEIETLFDRLIFDNHDSSSSQMLLLIAHQVREEYYRLESASISSLTATASTR